MAVSEDDAGAAYGNPLIGGLYELAARRVLSAGEVMFVKFLRRSHVEQADRPLVVHEPGFDSLSINTRKLMFSAKRLTPVPPKL